jgi:hypothetical protein
MQGAITFVLLEHNGAPYPTLQPSNLVKYMILPKLPQTTLSFSFESHICCLLRLEIIACTLKLSQMFCPFKITLCQLLSIGSHNSSSSTK